MELKISIVTCSDTRDLAQDEAGAALEELIEAQGWTVASHVVVRDDVSEIGDAIVEAAKDGPFLSKDDFRQRTKVSKTIIDLMDSLGLLGDLPESNQISICLLYTSDAADE